MRHIFVKYAVAFSLVIISGAMLLDVSQRVQKAEREVRRVDRALEKERESIRVLEAEWAYLNDPARLEEITAQGLDLAMQPAKDVISDMGLANPPGATKAGSALRLPADAEKGKAGVRDVSYTPQGSARAQ